MKELSAREFDARRETCGEATRNVLDFLMTAAEHAGPDVGKPKFEERGGGITYWSRRKRFCRFDSKHRADHVWAMIPGADRTSLEAAGKVSRRGDGPWVTIKNMRDAVRLVPEILKAYDAAGATASRRIKKA